MALTARRVLKTCPCPVGGRPHRKRGLPTGRLDWQREGTGQPHWQRESREYCSEQLHWQREQQPAERGPRPTWQPMAATSASQRSAEAR